MFEPCIGEIMVRQSYPVLFSPHAPYHTWNKLSHLAIDGQSHDSVKQSHDSANGPFFVTIKEGKGIQDSATMIK